MSYRITAILLALTIAFVFASCAKKTVAIPQTELVTTPEGETVTAADGTPVTQLAAEPAPQPTEQGEPVTTPEGETVTAAGGSAVTQPAAPEEDAPPPEDAPVEGMESEEILSLPPAEPATPLDVFNDALLDGFTDEEKSSQWFSAYGLEGTNGVEVSISMSQGSDDTAAAFALASRYYAAVKAAADKAGVKLASYEFTVLNEGATVGVYVTADGVTYNATVNGETTAMKAG